MLAVKRTAVQASRRYAASGVARCGRRALVVTAYKDDSAQQKQQITPKVSSIVSSCAKSLSPLRMPYSYVILSFALQQESLKSFPFSRPPGADPPREHAELRSKCPIAKVSSGLSETLLKTAMLPLQPPAMWLGPSARLTASGFVAWTQCAPNAQPQCLLICMSPAHASSK